MQKKRKKIEKTDEIKRINRNILIGFFIFLLAFAFFFYFMLYSLEKDLAGKTILIREAKQASRIEGSFKLTIQKGVCIPANSVVIFNFMGVQKRTTFANFVKIGKANLKEYYANFYVPNAPSVKGLGSCFGSPGVFSVSPFQKLYGFGERYVSEKYSVSFDLSALNLYVLPNASGTYPLEIVIAYGDSIIHSEIVDVSVGTRVSGEHEKRLLAAPMAIGEGVIITSDFEQGNLINVSYAGDGIYSAQINMSNFSFDPSTPAKYQWWFYFKADNCSGKNFVVNITNLLDEDVNENRWRNVWPVYSFDNNETWLRLNPLELNDSNYFKLYEVSGNNSYFIINITPSSCPVWIAALHPYSLTKSWNFINSITKYYSFVNVTTIGYSEDNREIKMITITDFNYNDTGKKKILAIAGLHSSGESQGIYALEGLTSYLTSNEPLAAQIRRNTIFKIVHIANLDGAYLGIPRFNSRDEDLNREWNQSLPPDHNNVSRMAKEVWVLKQQRISWLPDLLIDFHGSINDDVNYFIYPYNDNASYNNSVWNLMNNISLYWPEKANFRRASNILGAAIKNAYDENRTLALLMEFPPNCMDGAGIYEQANITTCFGKTIRTHNDWRDDGRLILFGIYSYICSEPNACSAPNLPPAITVNVPKNTTYLVENLTFEIRTNEVASSCWYSLDDGANTTMIQSLDDPYLWTKNVSLSLGQHNVIFYCNDSESALGNSSRIYFTIIAVGAPIYLLNSTNSTYAGQAVEHRLKWMDNIALSGYIFSFDNCTGFFTNDTWVAFSGRENWSNVTKQVNSTVGCTIRWCVYANNSNNLWNSSCTNPFSYITTAQHNITIILEKPENNEVIVKQSFPASQDFAWKVINLVNLNSTCYLEINGTILGPIDCINNTLCNASVENLYEGLYFWEIGCYDNIGNAATSNIFYFTLKAASSGGGGGGGAGGGAGGASDGGSREAGGEQNASSNASICGNTICEIGENFDNCCLDCGCPSGSECLNNVCVLGYCGDGICQSGETLANCMKDCFAVYCGNKVCNTEVGESSDNCCIDCGCRENEICKGNKCIGKEKFSLLVMLLVTLLIVATAITVLILVRVKKARERMRRMHLKTLMPETEEGGFKFKY